VNVTTSPTETTLPLRRHLLDLASMPQETLEELLALIAKVKSMHLAGETMVAPQASVANLFFESSTRTRFSFEVAEKRLGLQLLSFSSSTSSVNKGETLRDTANTLLALGAQFIVIRHASSGAAQYLAQCTHAQVINAGDGTHEHPTQGLLDAFTLRESWSSLAGKSVAIIGDIRHSRVARSNIAALPKLGASVRLFGPATLLPKPNEIGERNVMVCHSFEEAVRGADAVMMLRLQHERMTQGYLSHLRDYRQGFGLTVERYRQWVRPDALIMAPGPVNRGVEIDDAVADNPQSVITKQVENGVFTRMAVFLYLLGVRL